MHLLRRISKAGPMRKRSTSCRAGRCLRLLPDAVMCPEVQQIAFGYNPFQSIPAHDGDSSMASAEEGVGFLGQGISWHSTERRALQVADRGVREFLAAGQVAQQQVLGQAANHTPVL